MTEAQRIEIKQHLIHGLQTLSSQETTVNMVVENCPDETAFAAQLAQLGVNVAMHCRLVARTQELKTALKRLGETDYGICEECGESIGLARLKANPSARLCVVCQSEAEDGLPRCA